MSETGVEFFKKSLEKIKAKQYTEAINIIDNTISSVHNVYSITSNCSFSISEWEFLDDISECEKIVVKEDNDIYGLLALSLLFKVVNNYDRRRIFLQEAIKIDNTISRVWRDYGETNFHLGNIRESLNQFQEATNIDPKDPIAFEGIGLCYYYLDEHFKALTPLRKALSLNPENHSIMNHIAFILSEIGEIDEAFEMIKKALELQPDNNVYWDTYASILFLQDNFEESLKIFEKILSNNPQDWEVSWDILSNVYENLGLHVKAKQIEEKLHLK